MDISIMAVAEILTALNDAKQDIKNALVEKGVTPTGGLSTYADAVRGITSEQFPSGIKFAYSTFTEAPYFDTSAVTDFSSMFAHCGNLQKLPQYDTSNATTMHEMVLSCTELKEIPLLDCSNVERFEMFGHYSYPILDISSLGGFRNLGKSITDDRAIGIPAYYNVSFDRCFTTPQSMVNVFNELYDLEENGRDLLTIQINSSTKQNMTDEQIAIATIKGWNVIA
jgi:hypothetical protein